MMDAVSYFCSLGDDLFDLGDPGCGDPGDYYCDSGLASPTESSGGSDIENQLVYDPNTSHLLLPSSSSPSSLHSSSSPSSLYDPSPLLPHLQQGQGAGVGIGGGSGKPPGVKKVFQRKAANMRERRRMKSINDAFETLRTCIPNEVQAERRLSKVDTLRLAMRYIRFLSDLVKSCGGSEDYNGRAGGGTGVGGVGGRRGQRLQEKVIVRCRMTEVDGVYGEEGTLLGHSLSWDDPAHAFSGSKRVAKIWVPDSPTESDLVNLASYCSDC